MSMHTGGWVSSWDNSMSTTAHYHSLSLWTISFCPEHEMSFQSHLSIFYLIINHQMARGQLYIWPATIKSALSQLKPVLCGSSVVQLQKFYCDTKMPQCTWGMVTATMCPDTCGFTVVYSAAQLITYEASTYFLLFSSTSSFFFTYSVTRCLTSEGWSIVPFLLGHQRRNKTSCFEFTFLFLDYEPKNWWSLLIWSQRLFHSP